MADDKEPPQIKITTRLGDQQDGDGENRLILASVQCSEGFSKPYHLDCVMNTLNDFHIERFEMLNTSATVFIHRADTDSYLVRKGVFETFGRSERAKRQGAADVKTYHGRLVPAFKLMDREIIYRIFTNLSVIAIIQSCFQNFKLFDLTSYLNLSRVQPDSFPTLEYCVQFGESTLNFVSRLMALYGISYYFDHETTGNLESMVLCAGPVVAGNFKTCAVSKNSIGHEEKATSLAKYDRKYQFPTLLVSVGDFNPVVPTRPIQSGDVLLPKVNSNTSFAQQQFPYPLLTNNKGAHDAAERIRETSEGEALTIEAVSKNPTFFTARTLTIDSSALEHSDLGSTLLITDLSFFGFETRFLRGVGTDLFQFFIDDLLLTPVKSFAGSLIDSNKPDLATAMAAAGLNNYVKAWMQVKWSPPSSSPPKYPDPTAYFFAGAVAYLTALIPSSVTIIRHLLDVIADILEFIVTILGFIVDIVTAPLRLLDLLHITHVMGKIDAVKAKAEAWVKKKIDWLLRHDPDPSGYSNAFVAMDLSGLGTTVNLRLPEYVKPIAHGPHLATVVGDDGTDTAKGEISGDPLGRVRVRFPWDRHPTATTSTAATASASQDAPQFSTGANTCWLRVAEGWAGQGFGTQFLPRIGDEVIVEFLNGDPDRPIITGRVYNARGKGTPNLPFPAKGTESTSISTPDDLINLPNSASSAFQRSGIKTRSTPQAAGSLERYHLLRFDDTADKEQLLLRSQRRLDITAFGSRFETIAGDRHLTVGWVDSKHQKVGGDYIAKVSCDYHLHVGDPAGPFNGGNRYELVEKDYDLEVKNETNFKFDEDWSVSVGGKASISADTIVLKAIKSITLIVGNSIIVIQSDGIYNEAPIHYEQCGAEGQEAADAAVKPPKDPQRADPG